MRIIALLTAGGLALFIIAALITQAAAPSAVELQRQALEMQTARQLAPLDVLVAAAWRLLPLAVVGGFLAYLGALGVAHVARFRRFTRPDTAGRLPVLLDDQTTSRAALGAFHAAQLAAASRQPVPHHYAPHYHRADGAAGLELAGEPPSPALPGVATFSQLLDAGRVGRGNPLLLGFDETGQEIAGSWLDLYSTAVAGLPGTGKTTSQRFLAAQTALHGARFVVCDPHYGAADDSLGGALEPLMRAVGLARVASDDASILAAVRLVNDIGARRIAGDRDRTPVILWVDESTALLNRSSIGTELSALLESIAQEFRKVAVFASISGQIWTAERAGGSALRDSLASCLAHRMKRTQARMLVSPDAAKIVETLPVGRAVLYRTSGQMDTVTVPNTTAGDVRRVAALLTDNAPVMPNLSATQSASRQPKISHPVPPDYSASERQIVSTPEQARAVALFLDGNDASAIVTELTGMTSKAGKPYMVKLAEVQTTIRDAMRRTQEVRD